MHKNVHSGLGKRARQVLDLLYRRESLTATQLHDAVPELPSYSAARAILRRLEELGLATHDREGTRYVYRPAVPRHEARTGALQELIDTFFGGSAAEAMQALVDLNEPALDSDEAARLQRLIESAERRADGATEKRGK